MRSFRFFALPAHFNFFPSWKFLFHFFDRFQTKIADSQEPQGSGVNNDDGLFHRIFKMLITLQMFCVAILKDKKHISRMDVSFQIEIHSNQCIDTFHEFALQKVDLPISGRSHAIYLQFVLTFHLKS